MNLEKENSTLTENENIEETEVLSDNGQNTEYVSQFAEVNDDSSEGSIALHDSYAEPVIAKEKNKSFIMLPIIIAAGILLLSVIAFCTYKIFFASSIVGVWHDAKNDPDSYIEFTSDGDVNLKVGDMSSEGTYTLTTDEDGNSQVSLNHYYLSGDYTYTVTGNSFFGERTLTLGKNIFTSAKLPESTIQVSKKFKADKKLVGTWQYINDEAGVEYLYTFNADGTMIIDENNMYGKMKVNGVYTVSDNKINISYVAQEEQNNELSYKVKDNKLTMNNEIEFTKLTDEQIATIDATTESTTVQQ